MSRPVTFKIREYPAHGAKPFRVWFQDRTHWFATREEAENKIAEWKGTFSRDLKVREKDDYLRAKELMGDEPILNAVRFYIEHFPRVDKMKLLSEAAKEFAAQATGRPAYVTAIKYHMSSIVEAVGDRKLVEVSRSHIAAALQSATSNWIYNDMLRFSKMLFIWCIKQNYMVSNPTDSFEPRKAVGSKVWLSIPDVKHLIQVCRTEFPDILPAVGLQLFAGVRSAEISRLDWKHIRLGRSISIEEEVSKTGERRVIDWWPTALSKCFLESIPESGRIVDKFRYKKLKLIKRCRETKPDFKWGRNAFRHSYATYGCAFFQDSGKASLYTGHRNPNVFFNSYREYVTETEGKLYFSGRYITLGRAPVKPQPQASASISSAPSSQ